jgi:PAS domain S-box-containing protein
MRGATPLARLIIVDDEQAQMRALCETLEAEGYRTTGFGSPKAALATIRQESFDLILSDLMMPEMDGIALLHAALEIDPNLVGIVMTGHGAIDTAVKAMQAGALDYILKPFKLSAVLLVLSRALAVRRLRMENIRLQEATEIHNLSMAIALEADFDEVPRQVARAVSTLGGVRGVSVLLRLPAEKDLRVTAVSGSGCGLAEGSLIPFDEKMSGWLRNTTEPEADEKESPRKERISVVPMDRVPGVLSVPMFSGGELIGILNVALADSDRPVAPGQLRTLHILASTAASAVERLSLVERLRNAEQRYRRLAEQAPDIVFRYDLEPGPAFTYVNPAVQTITGYSAADHYADPQFPLRIVEEGDRPVLEALLRGEYANGRTVTIRYVHSNGGVVWLEHRTMLCHDDDGRLIAVEGIARDITERRVLEEQLRQSQKLEAIGLLAGGVAHDFNNLLTVINGYSSLILSEHKPGKEIAEKIDQIIKAGDHGAALTRQLLAFGRKQVLQPKILNLNTSVERTTNLLRRLIGEDIELVTKLEPRLGSVAIDPDQIEQIVLNLAVNSRDAMPQGGRITLETRNNASRVVLVVSDTGSGMDEATQSRVFEPFFTTKEPGKGTGLGLSIVYGAVKQSNGDIRLISSPGKGTTFEISLPRVDEPIAGPDSKAAPSRIAAGSETILLVEDDSNVRRFMKGVLRNGGYRVLDACDADDALEVCRQQREAAALVLTDLVLPGVNGTTLIEKLRVLNPTIKAIYMSGHSQHPAISGTVRESSLPFLPKPFSPDKLLRLVRDVLDRKIS